MAESPISVAEAPDRIKRRKTAGKQQVQLDQLTPRISANCLHRGGRRRRRHLLLRFAFLRCRLDTKIPTPLPVFPPGTENPHTALE